MLTKLFTVLKKRELYAGLPFILKFIEQQIFLVIFEMTFAVYSIFFNQSSYGVSNPIAETISRGQDIYVYINNFKKHQN